VLRCSAWFTARLDPSASPQQGPFPAPFSSTGFFCKEARQRIPSNKSFLLGKGFRFHFLFSAAFCCFYSSLNTRALAFTSVSRVKCRRSSLFSPPFDIFAPVFCRRRMFYTSTWMVLRLDAAFGASADRMTDLRRPPSSTAFFALEVPGLI